MSKIKSTQQLSYCHISLIYSNSFFSSEERRGGVITTKMVIIARVACLEDVARACCPPPGHIAPDDPRALHALHPLTATQICMLWDIVAGCAANPLLSTGSPAPLFTAKTTLKALERQQRVIVMRMAEAPADVDILIAAATGTTGIQELLRGGHTVVFINVAVSRGKSLQFVFHSPRIGGDQQTQRLAPEFAPDGPVMRYMQQDMCVTCRKTRDVDGVSLKLCGRCQVARYCSVECQRADWTTHRPHCKLFSRTPPQ